MADNISFLARVTILTFTEKAIDRFEELRTQRLGIKAMDLRIAAIVLEHGATLITRNVRDFKRVPGLTVENWA